MSVSIYNPHELELSLLTKVNGKCHITNFEFYFLQYFDPPVISKFYEHAEFRLCGLCWCLFTDYYIYHRQSRFSSFHFIHMSGISIIYMKTVLYLKQYTALELKALVCNTAEILAHIH